MRAYRLAFITAVAVSIAVSCSEDAVKSYVEGEVYCGACTGFPDLAGTLAKGGADYFGWCEVDGDNFNFTVATTEKNNAETASDFFFQFSGIKGPPTQGVYTSENEIKDERTTFSRGEVKNINDWTFTPDDATDPEACYVQLFATADNGKNELTPQQKSFDYFVAIRCSTLDVEAQTGSGTIDSVVVKLWFDNCD